MRPSFCYLLIYVAAAVASAPGAVASDRPVAPSAANGTAAKAANGHERPVSPSGSPPREFDGLCGALTTDFEKLHSQSGRRELQTLIELADARIGRLETATAALKSEIARREDFLSRVRQDFVRVIARMPAEAAASQLSQMQEDLAASILLKLDARAASAVLGEIPPARSSRITALMAQIAELPEKASLEPASVREPKSSAP